MTEISNADIYAKLRRSLTIDKMRLDDELISMPGLIHEAIECAANSVAMRDEAKRELDYVSSDVAMQIRAIGEQSKKPPEPQITTMTLLNEHVVEATQKYDDAKSDLAFWNAIVQGMEAKQTSLKGLVSLANLGYFTVESAHETARAEITKRRQLKVRE
jgi:hypothetical protein